MHRKVSASRSFGAGDGKSTPASDKQRLVLADPVSRRRCRFLAAAALALMTGLPGAATSANAQHPTKTNVLTVFAAASATECLTAIARSYQTTHGTTVRLNFASSSVLARQIKQGAPCDVFLSADVAWMDYLELHTNIQTSTRRDLLGNHLVIVVPTTRNSDVIMARSFDFPKSFTGRLAVGDPAHVPAGKYAKDALIAMGWWEEMQTRLAPCENVRAALRLVERGETDAGIVYSTDARASQDVKVVAEFPVSSHKPIRYPVALCGRSSAAAKVFLDYLFEKEAVAIWTNAGFVVLER